VIYTDTAPATIHEEITPSDTIDLLDGNNEPRFRALYVTAEGDLSLMDTSGITVVYPVAAGQILPFRPKRVMVASTASVVGWRS
jgi:hypothetical protein